MIFVFLILQKKKTKNQNLPPVLEIEALLAQLPSLLYASEYRGKRQPRKYGDKIDHQKVPDQYPKQRKTPVL